MNKAKEIAKETIFALATVVIFLAIGAMETEANVLLCALIAAIATAIAWICVDKTEESKGKEE